jgi:large subunit ribosomal protein L7/L12
MALQSGLRRAISGVPLRHRSAAVRAFPSTFSNRHFSEAPSEEASLKITALCDSLCELNVIEMNQLVTLFKDKVGLAGMDMQPQMGMPMMAAPAAGAAAAPAADEAPAAEKTTFNVKLASFDAASKIKVIKEIRAITGLGLKEVSSLFLVLCLVNCVHRVSSLLLS